MHPKTTSFLVGTSGWTYPHWQGRFYPADWPKSKWFEYYTQKFSVVEVNATFYRTFKEQTYHTWRAKAPEEFRYVLKAPRLITHRKYLKDVENECQTFYKSAALLEDRLGLILLQLAPNTPYEPERLRKALLAFDDPTKIAVEFRHTRWFTEETRLLLTELGAAFCTADSPKTELMDWLTADTAYFRLHGRKRWFAYDYSNEELRRIADLARRLRKRGAKEIYIFFNNDFEGSAPKNALALQEMLSV
jgi:uncharacterized protein YecE (DUF72 family)